MRKAAAVVSFFGAFVIGVALVYVADGSSLEAGTVEVSYKLAPIGAVEAVQAEDLVGVWSGTWDHGRNHCTIEIDRIDGTKFYGTLRESGAVVSIEGYIDPAGRRVHFKETRVIKLGPAMREWSLGLNSGSFSPDGRTLTGFGTDKWGTYDWDASKY